MNRVRGQHLRKPPEPEPPREPPSTTTFERIVWDGFDATRRRHPVMSAPYNWAASTAWPRAGYH